MNRTSLITLGIIVAVLAMAAAGTYWHVISFKDTPHSDATKTLADANKQSFIDLQGSKTDFSAYEGMIRIVVLWASWSPFSTNELTDLNLIAADYKDKNVAVIALDRKESKEAADRFLKTLTPAPNLIFAIDVNDAFYTSIGGYAMPEAIVYDKKGNIVQHFRGDTKSEEFRAVLDTLVTQK